MNFKAIIAFDAMAALQAAKQAIELLNLSTFQFRHIYERIDSILSDLENSASLLDSQSEVMEKHIRTEPYKMLEREDRDPDEIMDEEIHPDFKEMYGFEFEDPEDRARAAKKLEKYFGLHSFGWGG